MSWEAWGDPPEAYMKECTNCRGKGVEPDGSECDRCDGDGDVEDTGDDHFLDDAI